MTKNVIHPWAFVLSGLAAWMLAAQPADAQCLTEAQQGVQQWQSRMTQISIEYASNTYRVDDQEDPFDESEWVPLRDLVGACGSYTGTIKLLYPSSFAIEFNNGCDPNVSPEIYSSHDSEIRRLIRFANETSHYGSIRQDHGIGLLGSTRVLSGLVFKFLGREQTLAEYMAALDASACACTIEDGLLNVKCATEDEHSSNTFEITLDPTQGHHPRTIKHRRVPKTEQAIVEWEFRYLEIQEHAGSYLPARVVLYYYWPARIGAHNIEFNHYEVTDWRLVSARQDTSINGRTLPVQFPQGTVVTDYIRGERWTVGANRLKTNHTQIPGLQNYDEQQKQRLRVQYEGQKHAAELREAQAQPYSYVAIILLIVGVTVAVVIAVVALRRVEA